MKYTTAQSKTALLRLGYRVRNINELHQGVVSFQNSYNLGPRLDADGICGPKTSYALHHSIDLGGLISASFRLNQFDCNCGGGFTTCRRNLIRREQLRALEVYRDRVGHQVSIVSGYRCPGYNRKIGSGAGSQHPLGTGSDIPGELTLNQVRDLRVFSGIGIKRATGKVLHADVRHIFPRTNNGGSLSNPMTWFYA